MEAIYRLDLLNKSKELTKAFEYHNFEDLKKIKLLINGKETKDEFIENFIIGNKIKIDKIKGIYKITNIIIQNGRKNVYIEIKCMLIDKN